MNQLKAMYDLFLFKDDLFRNKVEIFRNKLCTGIGQNNTSYLPYLLIQEPAITTLCESIAKIKITRASPRRRLFS
jgi:hypothetical protein